MSFSPLVEDRVAAGLQWVAALAQNPRDVPMLGDSDTGVAVGWRLSDYWDFTALLAVGAVLFNRGDLIEQTHELPAEAFLMMGIEGLDTLQALSDGRFRQERDGSASAQVRLFRMADTT